MIEETPFSGQVKVITLRYGSPNDEPLQGRDPMAPSTARAILMDGTRFVTLGNATFLVGRLMVGWGGSQFEVATDADMNPFSDDFPEVWISAREIITIVVEEEDKDGQEGTTSTRRHRDFGKRSD